MTEGVIRTGQFFLEDIRSITDKAKNTKSRTQRMKNRHLIDVINRIREAAGWRYSHIYFSFLDDEIKQWLIAQGFTITKMKWWQDYLLGKAYKVEW